ncbi:ThiF family adenylyltransferase [Kocuria oceani]|uniref:ThiF family adenylyltransferase n=1 Tax=Kocuria oceani TaxID=988827 RepID=A0ABV9TQ31_9MICC|nr:ThiF family adenylyltransferase [Kocuria oceani]
MPDLACLRDGLLEQEKYQLQQAGYRVVDVVDRDGVWTFTVVASAEKTGMDEVELTVICPPAYPVMPPIVTAEQLGMQHHQNPFTGELCLLAAPTQNWQPHWKLAGLLERQLHKTLSAGYADAGTLAIEDEADQGEPYSAYYSYMPAAGFLIDSDKANPAPGSRGVMGARLAATQVAGLEGARLLGVIDELRAGEDVVYSAPAGLESVLDPYPPVQVTGQWVVLDAPPIECKPDKKLWEKIGSGENGKTQPFTLTGTNNGPSYELRAIGFPEEHEHGTTTMGWVFVLRQVGGINQTYRAGYGGGAKNNIIPDRYDFVHAYRAGRSDLMYRAPETHGLENRAITVIGCGAIGSVIIEHLARAGVGKFTLVDHDTVEPGNLSRHVAAFDTVGAPKVNALAARIRQINPYAQVASCVARLGSVTPDGQRCESDMLAKMFAKSDLVVDASADASVQEYTSLMARAAHKTWVCVDASPGIGGGTVVKIDAGAEACYGCFLWYQASDVNESGHIPSAVKIEDKGVQPAGCGQRTFTGTGFDLAPVSAQAARVAVGALLEGFDGGYPLDGFDAHILSLRDEHGIPCPPRWDGYIFGKNPRCGIH